MAIPPAPGEKRLHFAPTFARGLAALWLLTWRSRLTWRRAPMRVVQLLVLPALLLIITPSRSGWSDGNPWAGRAPKNLSGFNLRLRRENLEISKEQQRAVLAIYQEEYARAEAGRDDALVGTEMTQRRTEAMTACHARVIERVRALLSPERFPLFEKFDHDLREQDKLQVGSWTWGRTRGYYHGLVNLYFSLVMPLVCVAGCGAVLRDELQADTLGFLVTRPLTRGRLLLLKFFAEQAWLQLLFLGETLLLFAVGAVRDVPHLGALLPLFAVTQLLAVAVWGALGLLLGQLTQRFLAVGIVYGLIVEVGIGHIDTNINTLSMFRHLDSLLGRDTALQSVFQWPLHGVPLSVAAPLLATLVFAGVAALLFNFREYHHRGEMQK